MIFDENAGMTDTAVQEEPVASSENTGAEAEPAKVEPAQVESKPERMFTREQVNQIMKRRVERSHNAYLTRYGVKDLQELDNLVGQSRSYGPLKERFDELSKGHGDLENNYKDLQRRYAYKMGNIDEKRISDIEAYFKGKNIEIDENTLAQEIKTHPEWVKKVGKVQAIGAESTPGPEVDEREMASKYFGVDLKKKRG